MRGPDRERPAVQRLIDEVQLLHERLHRVTVALAITEDLLADRFEHMAEMPSAHSAEQMRHAKRARAAASECRMFAERPDQLTPDGAVPPRDFPRLV